MLTSRDLNLPFSAAACVTINIFLKYPRLFFFASVRGSSHHKGKVHKEKEGKNNLREPFKYFFADFVRKGGGGGTPQICNPIFAENFVREGGEGGTPQIRNLFFWTKIRCFFEQKNQFLALF